MQVVLMLKGSEQHHLASALWLSLNTEDPPVLLLWAQIILMLVAFSSPPRIRYRFYVMTLPVNHFTTYGNNTVS
jgi:hypothetical protein